MMQINRISVVLILAFIMLSALVVAADVTVSIGTTEDTYTLGAVGSVLIPVTVSMNPTGASVKDTSLYLTVSGATVQQAGGEYLSFFANYGTGRRNQKESDTVWTFFSGTNTPATTQAGATPVFKFNVVATAAGQLQLAVNTTKSSILERKGPAPTFSSINHTIVTATKQITINPNGGPGNPACAAADWTAGVWSACSQTQCGQAGTQTRTVNKNAGVTCDGEGGKPAVTQACTGTVCEEGTCVNNECVENPRETLRNNLKDKVDDVVDGLDEDQIPTNEDDTANFFRFISSLTRSLRELFS